MKKINVNEVFYEVIREKDECFNEEEFLEKVTDYFDKFDYILGDYAYEKLRLKGFYDSFNKNVTNINNIDLLDDYINNYCAHGAKYFLLKKK